MFGFVIGITLQICRGPERSRWRSTGIGFGTHGQEGFRWTEAGTFKLDEEVVELSLVDRTMSLQIGKQIGQRMKFLLGINGPDIYAFEVNYRLFLKIGTLCGFKCLYVLVL
ncbi:hypothetical protein [Paenibacillus agaridevorans]|uniref:hypothetical protein n=1 Tax=Paenibacillus agaridevorans TaxID=171404 RepID=UPI000D59EF0E|nr:hypothetical protein [Paenibacillus agaridevorans]